jgi:hypothetical protein
MVKLVWAGRAQGDLRRNNMLFEETSMFLLFNFMLEIESLVHHLNES